MSDSTMSRDTQDPTGAAGDASLRGVLNSLTGLVSSAEPAVVFASLVRLSVPSICEAATATVLGADEKVYAVSWPREALKHLHSRRGVVVTDFDEPASNGHPGYHGVFSARFGSQDPRHEFIAQLLVDRAMATVEQARLVVLADRRQAVAENLEVALTSNREISVAVGILMANHGLTSEQAFEVLRRQSQASNRKLRDIAVDVARTGVTERPTAPTEQDVLA